MVFVHPVRVESSDLVAVEMVMGADAVIESGLSTGGKFAYRIARCLRITSVRDSRNPCFGVRHNTETPRDRYVQTSELRALRAHMPAWMRVYILLKRLTGMRQADILALRRDAITGRGIEYVESKGKNRPGARRLIRWSWALRTTVSAALKLHGNVAKLPLFPAEHGGQFSRYGFRTAWARAMRKYVVAGGERFTEHDIRAKAGSDVGNDARAQELLGHKSVSTTRRVYRRGQVKVDPAR